MNYDQCQSAKKFLAAQLRLIGQPKFLDKYKPLDQLTLDQSRQFHAALLRIRQDIVYYRAETHLVKPTRWQNTTDRARTQTRRWFQAMRPSTLQFKTRVSVKDYWSVEANSKAVDITISPAWCRTSLVLHEFIGGDPKFFIFHSERVGKSNEFFRVRSCRFRGGSLTYDAPDYMAISLDYKVFGRGPTILKAREKMRVEVAKLVTNRMTHRG